MIIVCPHCGFRRDVPEERIPAGAVMATCPHCRHRFRFIEKTEDSASASPAAPAAAVPSAAPAPQDAPCGEREAASRADMPATGDDPLPPGARIPHQDDRPETANPAPRMEKPGEADGKAATAPDAEDSGATGTPWDRAPEQLGGIAAFYETCLRVMFAAPHFFSRLNPTAHQLRPLSFFLVVSVLQIVLERFWGQALVSFLMSSSTDDPQLRQLADMLSLTENAVLALIMRTAVLTCQLYITAAIYTFLLRFLAPGKQNFPMIFQVVAYAAAPEVLSIVPLLGSAAGMIWSVACCVIGLRHALRLSWPQAFGAVLPIYVLLLPVVLKLAAGMAAM